MTSRFIITIILILIFMSNCQICMDESCISCTEDGSYCHKCKDGFIRHYDKCGKKCSSIINCNLCNAAETKCIKCKGNCIFNGIYCDCTERYVLSFVCIFFSITMITVILLCLMNRSWRRTFNALNIFSGHIPPLALNRTDMSRHQLPEEVNVEIDNKIKELEIINDFNKNKITVDKNIETKKCCICNNNICNIKFKCGCFVCFECEKKCVKSNMCLNCKQPITTMEQVSCSICFENKKEISTFNCACKIVICKDCYLKWRKQNNFCPTCKGPII